MSVPCGDPELPGPLPVTGAAVPAQRARTFQRKKLKTRKVLSLELHSPMRQFFTGGVEYDACTPPEHIERFTTEFHAFTRLLGVPQAWGRGVELKFRRLGRHRADGLYYPDQSVLVLDASSSSSFAHEFGHLIDYRSPEGRGPLRPCSTVSLLDGFSSFHEMFLSRMKDVASQDSRLGSGRGRLSWDYLASRPECFARAFEQYASERLPQPSCLVGRPERYRGDPLFFGVLPDSIVNYFQDILAAGPFTQHGGCPSGRVSSLRA